MSQLTVGSTAPDFELKDVNGRSHRLSEALSRGPVALVFYKSECPTCQFTFPYIQKIFEKAGNAAGRTLWAVSEDDTEETKQFIQRFGLTFDVLIDEHPYAVSAAFGMEFVPGIFLVQPDGKISVSDFGFTKAGLNGIAGFEFFTPNDGLPASRPG
ncbi:MAG TPA: redoxin domain-containing protein [Terriglobia bacterium]|nr:redoxin domain-containing protein [Terriglobia bacterium]